MQRFDHRYDYVDRRDRPYDDRRRDRSPRRRDYSPPRRSRRSPSLSPLSRHRKLQRENKERAEKTAARKARAGGDSGGFTGGTKIWDGFQWVEGSAEAKEAFGGTSTGGALSAATRKERRVYVGNLPTGVGLSEKQIGEFIFSMMVAKGFVAADQKDVIVSVWVAPEATYAFAEFHTIEQANQCLALNGIVLLTHPLRISRPNNYNPNLGMPIDPAAALAVGVGSGGVGSYVTTNPAATAASLIAAPTTLPADILASFIVWR